MPLHSMIDTDPYERLCQIEASVGHLAQLTHLQTQSLEEATRYFKIIAQRLDLQQVELNNLRRRIQLLEAQQ